MPNAHRLTKRGWRDARDNNVPPVLAVLEAVEDIEAHLGLELPIRLKLQRGVE